MKVGLFDEMDSCGWLLLSRPIILFIQTDPSSSTIPEWMEMDAKHSHKTEIWWYSGMNHPLSLLKCLDINWRVHVHTFILHQSMNHLWCDSSRKMKQVVDIDHNPLSQTLDQNDDKDAIVPILSNMNWFWLKSLCIFEKNQHLWLQIIYCKCPCWNGCNSLVDCICTNYCSMPSLAFIPLIPLDCSIHPNNQQTLSFPSLFSIFTHFTLNAAIAAIFLLKPNLIAMHMHCIDSIHSFQLILYFKPTQSQPARQ